MTNHEHKLSTSIDEYDWVYYATPVVGDGKDALRNLVKRTKMIICHAYYDHQKNRERANEGEKVYQRLAYVRQLRRGEKVLLVYGRDDKYEPVLSCTIRAAATPLRSLRHSFDVLEIINDNAVCGELERQGYTPDPILNDFTGITVEEEDLRAGPRWIPRPRDRNTIQPRKRVAELLSASLGADGQLL